MFEKAQRTVVLLIAGAACIGGARSALAVEHVKLSGAIAGLVTDSSGKPEMGASVVLLDRQDRLAGRLITNAQGEFKFAGLFPDLYSVRITLAAFVPAMRRGILVQPGMQSLLAVNLNSLFSSIQVAYPPLLNGSLMTDDWKWALRESPARLPVLRLLDERAMRAPAAKPSRASIFSETRGMVTVSGGDAPATGVANQADLGAAFALATSVLGNNKLELAGNLGMGSSTGAPVAAFRTRYSRGPEGEGPKVSLTVRELYMPGRVSSALAGTNAAAPMLRSMSASFDDRLEITDELSVRYGATMGSVSLGGRLNYASPYVLLTYGTLDAGQWTLAYTSGDARPGLGGAAADDVALEQNLNTLGLFPLLSLRADRVRMQRGTEYEATYRRKTGSRTYEASLFREGVTDASLTMVGAGGSLLTGDVLPDLFTGNQIFNAGDYHSMGYTGAVTQDLGKYFSAGLTVGSAGALTVASREIMSQDPDDLRSMIHAGRRRSATARITAAIPKAGTRFVASYQVADNRWSSAGHLYSTDAARPMPGLNIYVRQPLPLVSTHQCRVEATADLRNLLAQGYLPLAMPGGQSLLLVQTPKSFRGGLNLIF
jgi:hypothetical protein